MEYVLILPMRNGNNMSRHPQGRRVKGFLSYLWGMETLVNTPFWSFYKVHVLILPMRNGNLVEHDRNEGQVYGSYPTYEEWKLPIWLYTSIRLFKVLILPMRNGNYFSKSFSVFGFHLFLSYLWGMETRKGRPQETHKDTFLSYLWGMETFLCFFIFLFFL